MRTITMPEGTDPLKVIVNGVEYIYPAGTEQTVPDEVADAIDAMLAALPKGAPVVGHEGQVWAWSATGGEWRNMPGVIVDPTPAHDSMNPVASGGVYDALAGKQNTLVSGDNVKTINGQSIVGSGNVDVGGISSWGDITGNLNDQTDLAAELNGKQATISDLSDIRTGAAAGATAVQPAAISDMATETWVGEQGYITEDDIPVVSVNGKTGTVVLTAADLGLTTVFNLKGSKPTKTALPASGNAYGDVWYVVDESVGYIWLNDGTTDRWEMLGLSIDLSNYVTTTALATALTGYVEKVAGKGLSKNDFTDALKEKLDSPDTAPTSGSNNLITSGGVYAYIQSLNGNEVSY